MNKTTFRADLVRHIMSTRGWTDHEMARRLSTSQAQFSKIKNHKLDFRLSTLERLASALEVEVWGLLHPDSEYVRTGDGGWRLVQIHTHDRR